MSFDIWISHGDSATLTAIELKSLNKVVDWGKVSIVRAAHHGTTRKAALCWALGELHKGFRNRSREWLRMLESCLKSAAKTSTAVHYVKLVALRGLQRMQISLRQKLASSAPVERLILRNRPRQLFAAHPPVAPPSFA